MTSVALSPMNRVDQNNGLDAHKCFQCGGIVIVTRQGTTHVDFDHRCLTWNHTRAAIKGIDYIHQNES